MFTQKDTLFYEFIALVHTYLCTFVVFFFVSSDQQCFFVMLHTAMKTVSVVVFFFSPRFICPSFLLPEMTVRWRNRNDLGVKSREWQLAISFRCYYYDLNNKSDPVLCVYAHICVCMYKLIKNAFFLLWVHFCIGLTIYLRSLLGSRWTCAIFLRVQFKFYPKVCIFLWLEWRSKWYFNNPEILLRFM